MNDDISLAGYAQALNNLTNEVTRLAGMMERLVTVEERNNQMDQKIDFIREGLNKDINTISKTINVQSDKLDDLQKFMWRVTGGAAVVLFVLEPLFVILLRKFI